MEQQKDFRGVYFSENKMSQTVLKCHLYHLMEQSIDIISVSSK